MGRSHIIRYFPGCLADIFQRLGDGVLMQRAATKLFLGEIASELYCMPCRDENIQ
jgi:hypothetical protein